ncbi:MAG: hypothetical protein K6E10_01065 [Eubacterium sp.]|nr:hypothetical protein [Eubacterium sp.]
MLSNILFERVKEIWEESCNKAFVLDMARGCLDDGRFRYYMIQDFLYLQDYIDILKLMLDKTNDPEIIDFLDITINATEHETEMVHIPNMKKLGIGEDEINSIPQGMASKEYIGYMKGIIRDSGVLAGLAALLHCSWVYAYIAEEVGKRYENEISGSDHKDWFDAYRDISYRESNQLWIDLIDKKTDGIRDQEKEALCQIFERCAIYENKFWDMVYDANIKLYENKGQSPK